MLVVTLPDGGKREYAEPVTVLEIVQSIGPGLAKAAVAASVNGQWVDLSYRVQEDADLVVVTAKDSQGLEVIRHSCAHLLAQAVKRLFPETQVTIGPVIEDGFYYDFARTEPFCEADLMRIEDEMRALAKQKIPVSRQLVSREDAMRDFAAIGEHYKEQIIQAIATDESLSVYTQGDFMDLCRGPHVPHTGHLKAFKLMKLAGAYWRGDANNEMLQRIYGTAWASQADLQAHLDRLAEAEKRDHRKLGQAVDLFHTQEEAPGMIFWHAKGWVLYQAIEQYMREIWRTHGYEEVHTPEIVDKSLWQRSGHWDIFQDDMFTTASESREFAVKPMNCPCHVQIYNQGLKSYRDLPYRLAEFGNCHRDEASGTLHGLLRVRNFVQDDAHIFCTRDQIQAEVSCFIDLLFQVYQDFGFSDVLMKLSTRPEVRVGADEIWDEAEQALQQALDSKGLDWELFPGEGAFYGPKIEFSLRDSLGRVWQCGTMQVDFSMPERLEATYVGEDGQRHTPVMLHRAIFGSMERFIGMLVEHYGGYLPIWLAPEQVVICNITDKQADYVQEITKILQKAGVRAKFDLRNEKIGYKIREHTLARVPYLLILGDREVESRQVSVRTQGSEDLGCESVEAFLARIQREISERQTVGGCTD